MAKFNCKICGKEFDRVGNAVYCSGPHYRPCPVCGKPVVYVRPSEPYKCCSKECTNTLSKTTMQSNFKEQECPECGKLFKRTAPGQVYCKGPHKSRCVICGNEFEYTCSPNEKPQTCSQDCANKLHIRTVQNTYGVDNVSELDWVRKKISERNSSEEVKAKREATNMKNHGVKNVSQSPAVRAKLSEIMQGEEYQTKRDAYCMEVWGYTSPAMHPDVKAKKLATFRKNHPDGYTLSESGYAKKVLDPAKVSEYLEFKADPASYILQHFDHKPHIQELRDSLGVTDTPIYDILIANNCSNLLCKSYSWMETEVYDYLKSIVPDATIRRNDRTAISPYELDFYLPEYNIGIECNPSFTHNASRSGFKGDSPKHYKYHQNKSKICKDAGIFLFHIFGYEWISKKDIIKSMLSNLLHVNATMHGARVTYVCEVSQSECKRFLNENHRQGYTNSKIKLGLRLKASDELVAVMTFGHVRNTMGTNAPEDPTIWELSRFCTKTGCNIAGGADKLFKHFLRHYNATKIISFSDFAHTMGRLYSTLGFSMQHLTEPSYVWVTEDDTKYYHRVSCQKQFLRSLLHDDTIDTEHHTEKEIMESHGFVRVYDSGVVKWEYQIEP